MTTQPNATTARTMTTTQKTVTEAHLLSGTSKILRRHADPFAIPSENGGWPEVQTRAYEPLSRRRSSSSGIASGS